MAKKLNIEDAQKEADKHNGKCLSKKYINNHTKLQWQCSEDHVWWVMPKDILKDHWCPYCMGNKKYSIDYPQEIAEQRNGSCLSKKYINANQKLKWKCNICNVVWYATFNNVKNNKSWCPKCMIRQRANKQRDTIENMQNLAYKHNGKCLSEKYVDTHIKLEWQCEKEHKFWMRPSQVKRNQWCSYCSNNTSDSEIAFREIMEQLFNTKFPKKRPIWLVNEDNNRLELDGYNKELGVAFEYQGRQHFEIVKAFKGTKEKLFKTQKHDFIKKELCKKHNIILLCPTYKLDENEFEDFIKKELNKYNCIIS